MTIDLKQLVALQKKSKASFFQQKKLVKQVISGQIVLCATCQQPLTLYSPQQEESPGIRCAKGCTDIQLDFV